MAKRWQIMNGYLHKTEILYMGESEKEFLVHIATDCEKNCNPKPPRGKIIVHGDIPEWMKTDTGGFYGYQVYSNSNTFMSNYADEIFRQNNKQY